MLYVISKLEVNIMIQAAVLFIIDDNVDLSKSLRQLFYKFVKKLFWEETYDHKKSVFSICVRKCS